jgi:hypothetical protein
MEGVVAAQVEEAPVPVHDLALAAGDDRAQVVVDAFARDAAEPVEDAHVALEERLAGHVEAEVRRLGGRAGQRPEQRVDAPFAARDPGPSGQLEPVELQHLARAVGSALGGALAWSAQLAQAALDDVDRALVAVVVAQDVGHARRLDVGALRERRADHRLEAVDPRAQGGAPVGRRLVGLKHPLHGPAVDPEPPRDLALRDPIGRHRPHLRPLQRAPHLLAPPVSAGRTGRA